MNVIKTDSLVKFYGKARGIDGINLEVKEGDFFGFIGPNGAGKSTTVRTLLGLISPTSGSAEIFGKDVTKHKTEILNEVGYMPSEAAFYPDMRVREVIKLSAALRKKDCAETAKGLCERLQLDTDKKIKELSLGNRKKVSVVCALQHSPRLCILDEPTSGLDPLMQREFYAILKELNGNGTTVFLSSHILSEVQHYCKTAAVIKDGKILVCDSIKNISHTEAKRVTLRGISAPPALDGIKDIKQNGDSLSFLYSGNPSALLSVLSKLPITDINIAEPDLEEIFMHYYAKEEQK